MTEGGWPLSDEDLAYTLEGIEGPDVSRCAIALRMLVGSPTGDARLLPAVEARLADRRGCVVGLPYRYGEVRWLAAHALASERATLGVVDAVVVEVVEPLDTAGLLSAAERCGVPGRGGVDGALALFDQLNDRGVLPRVTLRLP